MSTYSARGRLSECPDRARERGPALPPVLAALFQALAADTARAPIARQPADGLGGFKSASHLVTAMESRLNRFVTRRTLLGQLSALRRRLALAPTGRGFAVEHSRWRGWRLVARHEAATSTVHRRVRRICR